MGPIRRFKNCINLGEEFRSEKDKSVKMLIQGNRHVAKLMQGNHVKKEDFEEEGYLHYIKERIAKSDKVLRNFELFCFFGAEVDVTILRPRHYLTFSNYIRQMCDLPMIYCCDNATSCPLWKQINVYNENLKKMSANKC